LKSIVSDESSLKRMDRFRKADAFNGDDVVVRMHDGERETGVDPPAIHQDCAGTALAVVTTLFRACEMQVLA
jgi:hypothetical protein